MFGRNERSGVERRNYAPPGRWPANLILTYALFDDPDSPFVVGGGATAVRSHSRKRDSGRGMFSADQGGGLTGIERSTDTYFAPGGKSRYFQVAAETDE